MNAAKKAKLTHVTKFKKKMLNKICNAAFVVEIFIFLSDLKQFSNLEFDLQNAFL